ncbi:DUF3617 family protein [Luteibacter sp. SG786]|uniref:DUF3617 domain-containing protein n=1 Tax=Luteibacter sp. SG786 TaxID=2587130 RepID=UPI001422734D|nr:DUF3617 family protein [Luteibacter sp. SG786]NII55407.1 hypothetical protein [Luteibacter sp. SG786]
MRLSLCKWGLRALVLSSLAGAASVHADAGDFGAMPGLWKVQVRRVTHGKAGTPEVHWHCVDEGADPWTTFAAWTPGAGECDAADQQRRSTSLAWTLSCKGASRASAHVDFDSAKHYTGSVTAEGGDEITRIEGDRYAACTSPED